MTAKRLDYIDVSKGILIICVVIAHVFRGDYVHNFIHVFHVPAFFVISGFLFNYSSSIDKKPVSFIISRINGLLIPFLFFEVLAALWQFFFFDNPTSIVGYIYNTLTLHVNSSTNWFIITLFFAEILFYFAHRYLKNKYVLSVFALVFFVAVSFAPNTIHLAVVLCRILLAYSFIVFGYYALPLLLKATKAIILPVAAVITAVCPFINAGSGIDGVDFNSMILNNSILFFLGGIAGTVLIINMSKFIANSKSLNFFGKNSIIICGTQAELYITIQSLMGITDNYTSSILLRIIVLLATLLCCVGIIYLFSYCVPWFVGKKKLIKEKF